jgi:hypothetical protein
MRRVGCLVAVFALITPRFILFVLWLFTDYLNTAISNGWLGLLGFLFLPTTTIAYAIAKNEFTTITGGIEAAGILITSCSAWSSTSACSGARAAGSASAAEALR